jgi:CheY-like chemotaxis protein
MPERLGYRVTARTSSVEALQAFRSQPVNRRSLILLSRTRACPICPVRIWPERF